MISRYDLNFQSLTFSDWLEGTFYTDYNPNQKKKNKEKEQKPLQYTKKLCYFLLENGKFYSKSIKWRKIFAD